jgi:hypothetical protein
MTFSLPESLAAKFTKHVPARARSRYVADAIANRLTERERRLIESCDAANADPAIVAIACEFDALPDTVAEPWTNDPLSRSAVKFGRSNSIRRAAPK